jgi:FkbH-like protein
LERILLWSAETQQPVISAESSRKTEMVRAQLQRESSRRAMSHDEFLQTLQLRVSLSVVHDTRDLHMSRALELLNKTNQFNTTGERYTLKACHDHFAAGDELYVIQAGDRFTQYGLIGAAWVRQNCLKHVVMSCRALGLGIEDALLTYVAKGLARRNFEVISGQLQLTQANTACRDFYRRNGFSQTPDNPALWSRSLANPLAAPRHISLAVPAASAGTSADFLQN